MSDKMDYDKPGKVAAKMLAALAQDETRGGQSIPRFRARPAFLDSPTINATLDYMEIISRPIRKPTLPRSPPGSDARPTLRKGNILPAGETIKKLINYGRA
jgi:hypothetical protein